MGKRKSNAEPYFLCPSRTILSMEYKSMKATTRCVYIAFLTEWRRGEEQERKFKFPYTEIRKATGFNYKTIHNAVMELAEKKFIFVEKGALRNKQKCNKYKMNTDWLRLQDKSGKYLDGYSGNNN